MKKETKNREIKSVLKKIAELEKCSFEDVLKSHDYFFRKYNVNITEKDIQQYKEKALKSIKKPFVLTNK